MCFSPTASFAASAVLVTIGVACVSQTKHRRELPLALIPVIFGVQQATEGFLWLSLSSDSQYALFLTYIFLFFAFLWWPMYGPLAFYLIEEEPHRKKVIAALGAVGAIAGISYYANFLYEPVVAEIWNKAIFYHSGLSDSIVMVTLYVMAIIGSGLFSSVRMIKLFTLLLGVFALAAAYQYYVNFASVWCFFAAVLSIVLYFHFRRRKRTLLERIFG